MRTLFALFLVGTLGLLAGCGGGSTPSGVPITVNVTSSATSLNAGQSATLTATVTNDSSNSGVTWSLSGVGGLSNQTSSTATYTAPTSVTSNQIVSITATSVANTSSVGSTQITVLAAGASGNTQPIAVDGGPVSGQIYPDGAFTSVTLCAPGTSNCATVSGILVDTGSYGLRVLQSALNGLSLPPLTSSGQSLNECVSFLDGSYLWGNVSPANVVMAGETASSVSVQVIADPTTFTIPGACTNNGSGTDEDNQAALGANGILGIGPEQQDCGAACAGSSPPNIYWLCSSSGCGSTPVSVPTTQQVTNPIVFFTTDNNGVLVQFPSVSGSAPTVSGDLVFGINTQTDNQVGTATVYTMDSSDNFTTVFSGQTLSGSFLDSGSNGFFFPSTLTPCTDNSFYCPSSLQNLSAINTGATQGTGTVNFSIDNADNLFTSGDAAYGTLGGPLGTYPCNGSSCSFDWGLPFYFGRTVYTAIDGQTVSNEPTTPWWAY